MPRAFSVLLLLLPCFSRPVRAASACGAGGMREKKCAGPRWQRKEAQGSSPIAALARNRIICAVPNPTSSLQIYGIIHSNLNLLVCVWVCVCTCAYQVRSRQMWLMLSRGNVVSTRAKVSALAPSARGGLYC